ncbi:hypothetical protein CFN78_02275 [Amycolatopsis antarctica]|uniref:Uncharacterized protein n=1 Tax=Amycolatopsis antarctica TaxID=1854586 RepID=A0A263D947_9PSEU|nr:hypothetical protein [Amycolatopsis antarctica]OZM75032.1 hypothetical protein CFN78_02275 [Amycolatopsis antarctica]
MTATLTEPPAAPARDRGWIPALYRGRRWLWLVPTIPAAVITGLIMVVLPPDQTLDNVAEWAFKLSPFAFAVVAVALFPKVRMAPAMIGLGVIVYMGYLDTEFVMRIQEYGRTSSADDSFQPIYQFELFITTFIVLFALMAYRLGGARTANVLKAGVASILVVVSGLNDLTFWALNEVWAAGSRPTELKWASHIIVFVGGPPSVATAVVFMLVHLVLAGIVIALPLGRWVDRALGIPST